MSTEKNDDIKEPTRGPCPDCGTEIWTFDPFVGLLPIEVSDAEPPHNKTLCEVRQRLAAVERERDALIPLVSVTGFVAGPTWKEVAEAAEATVAHLSVTLARLRGHLPERNEP